MWKRRGLRISAGVPKGFLHHLTLQLLKQRPMSGSEIMDQLQEYTDWRPSPGSVYPLLSLLQDEGLIRSHEDGDPSLKRFALTEAGLQEINELTEHSQHMRNRNKSMQKIYWRLHMEMPEGLYESLSGFMDAFEAAYTMYKGDPKKALKLKGVLDRATDELKETEV
jgi:DNA-binding PadR family transcriptional regulator